MGKKIYGFDKFFLFQYGDFYQPWFMSLEQIRVNTLDYDKIDKNDPFFESVDHICKYFVKDQINVSRLAPELNSLLQAFGLTNYFDKPPFTDSEISNKKIAEKVCAERELLHGVQKLLFQEMFKMLNGRCQDFLLSTEEAVRNEEIEQKKSEQVGEKVTA